MHPLVILLLSIAVVFLLILRLKINAFLALITAAMTVGLLSTRIPLAEVMPKVAGTFGTVCGKIAIVIALAALVGECMMESGAADKITRVFVRLLGQKRASLSLLSAAYVESIPVFFDTVFYLMVPLARAMRVRTGRNYLLYVMAIAAGGAVAHSLIPPTPGPVAMAAALNLDLGAVIIVGFIIGIPTATAGWLFSVHRNHHMEVPFRETSGMSLAELRELALQEDEKLPGFLHSLAPILLPVLFITSNTVAAPAGAGSSLLKVTSFLGNPNFALMLSAAISLHLVAKYRGYTLAQLVKPVETALASGGLIILITAGGGAFGGMLVEAGVGQSLGDAAQQFNVPLLLLGFLLAVLLKIAQGSGTVAMITVSSIMAPLIVAAPPAYHPVYVAMAIGSGSLVGSWMNDSGFWIFAKMSGLTEAEALKTWTPLLMVLGCTGFLTTVVAAMLVPLR